MKHKAVAEVTNRDETPWLSLYLYVARPGWSDEFVSKVGLAATVREPLTARTLFVTLVKSECWAGLQLAKAALPPRFPLSSYSVLALPGAAWADVRRKCETVFRCLMPSVVVVDHLARLHSPATAETQSPREADRRALEDLRELFGSAAKVVILHRIELHEAAQDESLVQGLTLTDETLPVLWPPRECGPSLCAVHRAGGIVMTRSSLVRAASSQAGMGPGPCLFPDHDRFRSRSRQPSPVVCGAVAGSGLCREELPDPAGRLPLLPAASTRDRRIRLFSQQRSALSCVSFSFSGSAGQAKPCLNGPGPWSPADPVLFEAIESLGTRERLAPRVGPCRGSSFPTKSGFWGRPRQPSPVPWRRGRFRLFREEVPLEKLSAQLFVRVLSRFAEGAPGHRGRAVRL